MSGGLADRLVIRGSGQGNALARAQGGTLSNSIVISSGENARTVNTDANGGTVTSTLRNVTAIAKGAGSTAVLARADGTELQGGHATVNAYNVIAEGDVKAEDVGAGDTSATINMTSSAYDVPIEAGDTASVTPAGSGSNTTDAPQFVNAAMGNYRQAAGSPTIDAGSNAGAIGLFDVFGDPRKSGPVDIGADEFVHAPLAGTGPAVNVSATTATVSANVNPRGVPTTYRFNIGTTTAYGVNTAVASAGSGSAGVFVTVPLTGLKPLTTYHYRVVATSSAGTSTGADRSFRTPPPFPGVTILKNDLALEDGRIKVKLACPAGVAPPCSGTVTLNAKKPRKNKKPATVKLGTKPFTIAAGKTKTVKVKPSDKALGKLSSLDSVKGRAMVSATDGAGQPKVTSRKVEISL